MGLVRPILISMGAVTLAAFLCAAGVADPARKRTPSIARHGGVLISSGSASSFKTTTPDTVYLYGGPGSLLGKFQTAGGAADVQGWTSRDVTDQASPWQAHIFNSPTGSTAMWAGRDALQELGWVSAPGYGNSWNALLEYRATVSDPSQPQTVNLDFVFNHETEPGYDYFDVEYDSAGFIQRVLHLDATNKDSGGMFVPASYAAQGADPIRYGGNDYAGGLGDEIVIRFAMRSDGAYSDEDGLFPTDGGVQVDDIQVGHLDGVDFEDFEGASESFLWQPKKGPYAGDFGNVFTLLDDPDPCASNATPALGFIDDGNGPYNPGYSGTGTGGTTSLNWSYGVPGGWVISYNGGISVGAKDLDNEWWSPEIDWDPLGGSSPSMVGVRLRFGVWAHLPLVNGFFFQWAVRGYETGIGWSRWANRNFVYYAKDPAWLNVDMAVTDLLPSNKDKVQVQLAVRDLATIFAFAGTDATPSPLFDQVSVAKYDISGPVIAAREIDLLQDSFSQSGGTAVSTRENRDLLDVRIDMARDVSTGPLNRPGDSLLVDVGSVLPGVAISDPASQLQMVYSLHMNPLFEPEIRENAPVNAPGSGRFGWDRHTGSVPASPSTNSQGFPIPNRYFFDLPDADFMYPGDYLEFYIRAEDDAANVSTLPRDLSDFGNPEGIYDRRYSMHALPSYQDTDGSQPTILYWNDAGHGPSEAAMLAAIDRVTCGWLQEGDNFDVYTTAGASSMVSNGLGSSGAHGATADQLAGYEVLFYDAADLSTGLISNGSNAAGNDKSDDSGVLLQWWSTPGADRGVVHFGDNLATMLSRPGNANNYLAILINATWVSSDVRASIDNQVTPRVEPGSQVGGFSQEFVADGSCPRLNQFDQVVPGVAALSSHWFMDPSNSYGMASAGIYNGWTDAQNGEHQSLLYPFGFLSVRDTHAAGDHELVRMYLFQESLLRVGAFPIVNDICHAVEMPRRSLVLHPPHPNPFNPSTTFSFDLGRDASGVIRIYNLRGALVHTLEQREFSAGRNMLRWDGSDASGNKIASGVYLVRFLIDGLEKSQKVLLLK